MSYNCLKGIRRPNSKFWTIIVATVNSQDFMLHLYQSGNSYLRRVFFTFLSNQFVGNKAEGRISKRVIQENKACQIFRKTNVFYPLISTRYVCVSGGKKCSLFGKFDMPCFLDAPVLRFTLFAFLPANC